MKLISYTQPTPGWETILEISLKKRHGLLWLKKTETISKFWGHDTSWQSYPISLVPFNQINFVENPTLKSFLFDTWTKLKRNKQIT